MRANDFITEDTQAAKDEFLEIFKKFMPIAMHYLKLKNLPKMKFTPHVGDQAQPTFGVYDNSEKTLHVALANRHPNDILRTIAHELQHFKQDSEHQLNPESGTTGSPEENEAHAMAGIVMRHFNKQYPEYLNSKPIMLEGAVSDLEKDLKNPTSYNAIDHMMTSIAKKYKITPKELHDKFLEKNGVIPDEWIKENFADGRNPQDKGDSKRYGINTKSSVSSLRKTAKQGGRKGQLAHWLANMKAGRAKSNK